ncbi:MAG: porin [Planctomycetota bacterium]|nr:porin [Planctomycetota bacterium]
MSLPAEVVAPAAPDTVIPPEIEARLNALQNEVNLLREQNTTPGGLAIGRRRSTDVPRVEDAAPTFPKIKLTGCFQADAGWIDQSANSLATFGDIEDDAGFRRARLAAVGDVSENVSFLFEMDFAFNGRPSFMDVWLDIHDIDYLGNIRIGQWRQPFGMDNLNSVRELTFLERPLIFAFAPFRQTGIGFHNTNEDQTVTWAFSGFRFPADFFGGIGSPGGIGNLGDRGYGLAGRVTGVLLKDSADSGALVHIGADYSYISPGGHTSHYRNVPEYGGPFVGPDGTAGSIPFFIDTGAIPANHVNLYNAEIGARHGSLYGQGEATYAIIQDTSGNSLSLPGAYGQVGYFLTGEERTYNKASGVFGRVKPLCPFGKAGWGAWEIATRYSYINMNDVSVAGPTTPGGRLNNMTYGVNWYLNQYTKFQFNFIQAMLDRPANDHSVTNIYAVRAQLDF